jgi:hypothetical protein
MKSPTPNKAEKSKQPKVKQPAPSDPVSLVAGSPLFQTQLDTELASAQIRFYALQEFSSKVVEFKVAESRSRSKLRK